jgi:hypothetical protein
MPLNMVRMGLTDAHGPGIKTAPRYGSNWKFKPMSELQPLHSKLMGMMKDRPYGLWMAVKEVFGRDVADSLASSGECVRLNIPKAPAESSKSAGKKRQRDDATASSGEDNDDDDDDARVGSSKLVTYSKRHRAKK